MRRRLWLLLAVTAALALASGTGGFSAATLDRPVSVAIADHPSNGFVGILGPEDPIELDYGSNDPGGNDVAATGHEEPTLLVLQNNLRSTVTYEIRVSGDENTPPDLRGQPYFADSESTSIIVRSGTAVELKGDITCAKQDSETWTVHITVEAEGLEGTVDHDITVACDGPPGQERGTVTGSSENETETPTVGTAA